MFVLRCIGGIKNKSKFNQSFIQTLQNVGGVTA